MALLATLAWLAGLALLAALGLPVAARLFGGFPHRGATLALPVALAVLGLATYWVGHVATGPALLAGVLVLGALAALARRDDPPLPDRRALVAPVAVFLAAFALLLGVRLVAPGIVPQGGEKFLDYALLRATLRADRLPPVDPWFAGRRVRYYYGGHLLVATLTRLTGVPPATAFNLALAGTYATLATAAYGVAAALADRVGAARSGGLLGAFFVALAGPLVVPARVVLGLVPESLAAAYGRVALVGIRTPLPDALDYVRSIPREPTYAYWHARYVVPDVPTVFPLWTFANGDLRPHMVGAPLLVLVAALCLAYHRTPAGERGRRRLIVAGALPALAGLLAVVNTWSLPAAVGLVALTLAMADAHPATLLPESVAERLWTTGDGIGHLRGVVTRLLAAGVLAAVVAVLAVAWAAPLVGQTATNRGVTLLPPRSGLGGLVLAYGGLVAVLALALAGPVRRSLPGDPRLRVVGAFLAGGLLAGLVRADLAAVALVGPLVAGGVVARRRGAGFVATLAVAGAGLVLVPEFAVARVWPHDPNAPRWNTVYKLSMQTWILWGLGAGGGLGVVLARARRSERRRRALVAGAVVVLVGLAGVFPVLTGAAYASAADEAARGGLTLDGTAWVDEAHPVEARAIDWLAARDGRPTLVSRPGTAPYTWVNAPSALTGLPTVAGWRHVAGYHGLPAYRERVRAARSVFTGNASAVRGALAAYDVNYVYVGPGAIRRYGPRNLDRLDGVSVAYDAPMVTVYAVSESARGEWDGQ